MFQEGKLWVRELIYETGLTNADITHKCGLQRSDEIIADSAEPKSIDEILAYGINIVGAQKGPGSVNQGIQYVQDQRISVTRHSTNIIREYRNYLWKVNKEGITLNVPEAGFDHSMDAIRYGLDSFKSTTGQSFSKDNRIKYI